MNYSVKICNKKKANAVFAGECLILDTSQPLTIAIPILIFMKNLFTINIIFFALFNVVSE
jgi:hypothetical protein